jgi:hypothetical protein
VEVADEQYLELAFPGDDEGQLYDGSYLYNANNRSYTLLDFNRGVDDLFQLEEGTDNGNAEIVAVSSALRALGRGDAVEAALDGLLDWDQVHRAWAGEELIGHLDGYMLNTNNYRAYFRPSDGRMGFLPTDFDYAFQDASNWGMDWTRPRGTLADACWDDATCAANHAAAVEAVIDAFDMEATLSWLDEIDALTLDLAEDDPRRECGTAAVSSNRASLRAWTERQVHVVESHWGL